MDSQLIIHSTNQRIYSCCFCWEAVVCLAGQTSLQLWDALQGTLLSKFQYGQQLAPISVNSISQEKQRNEFLLQDKSGLILLIQYRAKTASFNLLNSYEIEPIGFTKICPWLYVYIGEDLPLRQRSNTFCTIFRNEEIQQRNTYSGQVIKRFSSQDIKFVDVTAMTMCRIQNKNYLIIAEEGNTIKRVQIDASIQLKAEHISKMTLQSEKEVKIVLEFEPIETYRVVAVLREDRLVVIDLAKMEVFANIQTFKMMRSIKVFKESKLWAFSQKKAVGLMYGKKAVKKQKIFTQLIIGIDTCQWGVVGASEQGKLFALPL